MAGVDDMMSDLPDPQICECGYRVKWYVPCDLTEIPNWYGLGFKLVEDVVERPCPHRNGTVIQHCPQCDRQVDLWGCGPAGAMECACWDDLAITVTPPGPHGAGVVVERTSDAVRK